jgi:hypothetical protein
VEHIRDYERPRAGDVTIVDASRLTDIGAD